MTCAIAAVTSSAAAASGPCECPMARPTVRDAAQAASSATVIIDTKDRRRSGARSNPTPDAICTTAIVANRPTRSGDSRCS